MYLKRLILTLLFIVALNFVYSQVINLSPRQDSTTVYEKLYLHTDREIYSPGDDIWFKSYLVSGINHQYIPGFKNIYVQLITDDGKIIDNRLMLSVNGEANNDFHLPDTLQEGTYTIRAYTKYLQNFGEKSLFHKKIEIAKASDTPDVRDKNEDLNQIDVSFLPEGGTLVLNATNRIAFKAIDGTGRGIKVSGKIVDETGETVTTFKSRYKGMGSFMLMPQEGKTYYAKLDNYPDFNHKFENIQPEGIALHYESKENNLVFTLIRNIKSTGTEALTMVVWHKNQEVFTEEIEMEGFQYPVEIYKGFFPEGISKITIADTHNNIKAERLIFVRNENEKTLEITTDKQEYGTREEAKLSITSLLEPDDTIQNTLSVAIVSEDYFSVGGNTQTIESYLLLDSELKGPVESPASYFTDEEDITAQEKLDLVMQVNGWRRYYWDELNKYDWQNLPNWDDAGLTVQGKVTALFGEKPVEGGIVKMGPFSSLFTILRDTIDETGHYQFNRLFLKDSAVIMINAENKRGSNNVEIINETLSVFESLVSMNEINNTSFNVNLPYRFYEASYFKEKAETEFKLEDGSILIKDVEVLGEQPKFDGHFTIYGEADNSLKVTQDDWTYIDILDYLQSNMVAGVVVTDNSISIRGSADFYLLIDGVPPLIPRGMTKIDYIRTIPIQDVDKIDILKSGFSSVFAGSKGAAGIISILTRTGFNAFENEYEPVRHGKITPEFTGFRQAREFYAPKYPLTRMKELRDRKPDFRPTLYWNPDVMLENGEANLEFFTSDMAGRYQIVVEGISNNGRICYGTTLLDVGAKE